jgi:hypothetical protein
MEPLQHQPRILVRELFVMIWKSRKWSLRGMTHKHWNFLSDIAVSPSQTCRQQIFPGKIIVKRDNDRMILREEM